MFCGKGQNPLERSHGIDLVMLCPNGGLVDGDEVEFPECNDGMISNGFSGEPL